MLALYPSPQWLSKMFVNRLLDSGVTISVLDVPGLNFGDCDPLTKSNERSNEPAISVSMLRLFPNPMS
jgi:hypothetical protein